MKSFKICTLYLLGLSFKISLMITFECGKLCKKRNQEALLLRVNRLFKLLFKIIFIFHNAPTLRIGAVCTMMHGILLKYRMQNMTYFNPNCTRPLQALPTINFQKLWKHLTKCASTSHSHHDSSMWNVYAVRQLTTMKNQMSNYNHTVSDCKWSYMIK